MKGGGFTCEDGQCVKAACDGQQECNDRSDDNLAVCGQNCSDVEGGGLVCADGWQCIKASKKCDRGKDCDDLSDEDIDTCGKALGNFHKLTSVYQWQARDRAIFIVGGSLGSKGDQDRRSKTERSLDHVNFDQF